MKNNKKLKGFTLIELIIVLALFSLIMVLVMSFIDPVQKLMTKASTKERTAAYVDNVTDYLDHSLRYAQFMHIYSKGICDMDLPTEDIKTPAGVTIPTIVYPAKLDSGSVDKYDAEFKKEYLAVLNFADYYFDGAIKDGAGTPVKGKIHVLRLFNDNLLNASDKPGMIYESTWDFTAGKSYEIYHKDRDPSVDPVDYPSRLPDGHPDLGVNVTENVFDSTNGFPHSTVSVNRASYQVINPEHFINYSYYYTIGAKAFEPIPEDEVADYTDLKTGSAPVTSSKYYYSRITKRKNSDGSLISEAVNKTDFTFNVVAYQDDNRGNNRYDTTFELPDGSTAYAPIFKSPTYMSSTGMALINVINSDKSNAFKYYKMAQELFDPAVDTSVKMQKDPVSGKPVIETISRPNGFRYIESKRSEDADSDNLIFIYVLADEVDDTELSIK